MAFWTKILGVIFLGLGIFPRLGLANSNRLCEGAAASGASNSVISQADLQALEEHFAKLPDRPALKKVQEPLLRPILKDYSGMSRPAAIRRAAREKAGPALTQFRKELNGAMKEKSAIIRAMIATSIAGGVLVVMGAPGNGKTRLAELFLKALRVDGEPAHGAIQFEEGTQLKHIFGDLMPPFLLKLGISVRNLPDSLFSKTGVFLDEYLAASGELLVALNTWLQTGVFAMNGKFYYSPVRVVFGATNVTIAEAFLEKFRGHYDQGRSVFDRIDHIFLAAPRPRQLRSEIDIQPDGEVTPIDVAHFEVMRALAEQVRLPRIYKVMALRFAEKFEHAQNERVNGVRGDKSRTPYFPTRPASPRTAFSAMKYMKVAAALRWVNDRTLAENSPIEVNMDDFFEGLKLFGIQVDEIEAMRRELAGPVAQFPERYDPGQVLAAKDALFENAARDRVANGLREEYNAALHRGEPERQKIEEQLRRSPEDAVKDMQRRASREFFRYPPDQSGDIPIADLHQITLIHDEYSQVFEDMLLKEREYLARVVVGRELDKIAGEALKEQGAPLGPDFKSILTERLNDTQYWSEELVRAGELAAQKKPIDDLLRSIARGVVSELHQHPNLDSRGRKPLEHFVEQRRQAVLERSEFKDQLMAMRELENGGLDYNERIQLLEMLETLYKTYRPQVAKKKTDKLNLAEIHFRDFLGEMGSRQEPLPPSHFVYYMKKALGDGRSVYDLDEEAQYKEYQAQLELLVREKVEDWDRDLNP